eukprot:EG_transcript_2636
MLIPPTRAHRILGWSWKLLPEFHNEYFMVEQIEKWAVFQKLKGPVQYRVIHIASNLVVAECVSFSGLVDDWNCLVTKAGTDTTSVEELCDLGFTTAAAEVAIAKAKRNPLGCMQDLILINGDTEQQHSHSARALMKRCFHHHKRPQVMEVSATDLLWRRPSKDNVQRSLELLDMLLLKGFLDEAEYEIRKEQLLQMNQRDQHLLRPKDKDKDREHWMTVAFPQRKPKPERVNVWRYDAKLKHWSKTSVEAFVAPHVYEKGSMRLAYRMKIPSEPKGKQEFIAKKFINEDDDDNERYFTDVLMQSLCQEYAMQFNQCNPPKKVQFIDSFIIELVSRKCKPDGWNQLMSVEPFMPGEYQKYNNNFGWVSYLDRNTPQAFSHFTYVASDGEHLVTDIQGVGDVYTDPQIHSWDGQGFGEGNYGKYGIEKFFSTHYCNSVCQYLGLSGKGIKGMQETGLKEADPRQSDASLCSTRPNSTVCGPAARGGVLRTGSTPAALPGPAGPKAGGAALEVVSYSGAEPVHVLTAVCPAKARTKEPSARKPASKQRSRRRQEAGSALKQSLSSAESVLADIHKRYPGVDLEFYHLTEEQFYQVVTIFEAHCDAEKRMARDQLLPILRDLGIEAPIEDLATMVLTLDEGASLTFEQFLCWWTGVEPKEGGGGAEGGPASSARAPSSAGAPATDRADRRTPSDRPTTPAHMVARLTPRPGHTLPVDLHPELGLATHKERIALF